MNWNPNAHPRDAEGKFTETNGGGLIRGSQRKIQKAFSDWKARALPKPNRSELAKKDRAWERQYFGGEDERYWY